MTKDYFHNVYENRGKKLFAASKKKKKDNIRSKNHNTFVEV